MPCNQGIGVTEEHLQPTQVMEQPNRTHKKERIVDKDGFQSVRGKKSRNREQGNDCRYMATYNQWPQGFDDCAKFTEEEPNQPEEGEIIPNRSGS